MHDVFISYARADRDRARLVAEALGARGHSVWWDHQIPPGKSFDQMIEEALDSARCVVVLWSQASAASHWVKTEAAEGLQRKVLVPVLLDDVRIPLEFRRIQAARLVGWNGSAADSEFAKLCESVARVLGGEIPDGLEPAREASPEAPAGGWEPEPSPSATAPPETAEILGWFESLRPAQNPARRAGLLAALSLQMALLLWISAILLLYEAGAFYLHRLPWLTLAGMASGLATALAAFLAASRAGIRLGISLPLVASLSMILSTLLASAELDFDSNRRLVSGIVLGYTTWLGFGIRRIRLGRAD